MQKARQYELIHIVAPESTEEMVADLQTQVEDVVSRFDAKIKKTDSSKPWKRGTIGGGEKSSRLHRLHNIRRQALQVPAQLVQSIQVQLSSAPTAASCSPGLCRAPGATGQLPGLV